MVTPINKRGKTACAWLPTRSTWDAFISECGIAAGAVAEGDAWAARHADAVDAVVALLKPHRGVLILSTPELALDAVPGADLRSQPDRARVAEKLAARSKMVLGLKVTANAIGSAIIQEPEDRWHLVTIDEREGVRILEAKRGGAK
jgi:hypothetical protein